MRSVGNRWGNEARSARLHGSTIFDLLAKYKWNRYEFLFSIVNLANKKWRAAQFFHESQLKIEECSGRRYSLYARRTFDD
jgi:outer membrane receptor protein involved in Fe transport